MFIDRVEVSLQAGDGGDGAMSFRHEKFIDRGGPDGGDGGRGGDLKMLASRNQNTLATYRYKKLQQAEHGQPGSKNNRHGKNGQSLVLAVPVGTVVSNLEGEVLADFIEDGQAAIIATGGSGGFGNSHFVSSTRQAPRISEKGEKGQHVDVVMELKMIADVGLVGLPNAGKSTLLSVLSNAKPAIADYPFTTLTPNLGVVDIEGSDGLLLADIPGLIEGASEGKGLGDDFLRHVERTRVLVHLVDAYNPDISAAYKTIIKELKAYKVDLSKLPQIVILTKIEGLSPEDLKKMLAELKKAAPKNAKVMAISAQSGKGLKELKFAMLKLASRAQQKAEKVAADELPVITFKPRDDAWTVTKNRQGFKVVGKKIERFASRTRFGDRHGEQRLRDIMRKMGIINELKRLGIEAGQSIQVGDPSIGKIEY